MFAIGKSHFYHTLICFDKRQIELIQQFLRVVLMVFQTRNI
jgi:hypothetical protein